ncbi:protein spinster homolog 1 [Nephila pilipes]|uniref:Protein spinster homolog 1 n=1 Tax=Nephila pilipes TaxID=299642 RepID=A0A8X6UKN6_NEPPI|nr:protein spinster homolog 1 [Nephila pilipes]
MPSHLNPVYTNEDEFSFGDRAIKNDPFNNMMYQKENLTVGSLNGPKTYRSRQKYITVAILCFINLINYIDRFTIAGILKNVQAYYSLQNATGGLLQTSFICSYMIMAPVFGYLGDRFSRKIIIACGVAFWSMTTLLGSFVPSHLFGIFIFLRALVGTGEASYSTIAPTIIGDLFSKDQRSKMLAIFYFAIPVGSGLGYIVGDQIVNHTGEWQWALRVTPVLGFISVLITFIYVKDPPRGEADGGTTFEHSTLTADLLDLFKTKSFVYSTLGFTSVTFATGALGWFGPKYMELAFSKHAKELLPSNASLIFGIITCIAGIVGVIIGSSASQYFRRMNARADPLICAYGVIISVPLIFSGVVVVEYSILVAWILIFLGEVCLCVNWTIVADMLLYVIVPTRRSIAEAVQILVSHAFGDAASPYIIGLVSDKIFLHSNSSYHDFLSLQYALYIPTGVLVIGAFFFFLTAIHIEKDKAKCSFATHAPDDKSSLPAPPYMLPVKNALTKNEYMGSNIDVLPSQEVTVL